MKVHERNGISMGLTITFFETEQTRTTYHCYGKQLYPEGVNVPVTVFALKV